MKKRLHDKKAGVAILISLIIISLADIIFRATVIGEAILTTSNLGEQLAVVVLAATILILTAKGKDRACYICYGAWIGYFALDQLFELPSVLTDVVVFTKNGLGYVALSPAFHVLSMICIIALGVLLLEYMTDGTICNRAFNIFSVVAILSILGAIIINVISIINGMNIQVILATFNNVYRIAMVFLFTFFAYDSAKAQLKKTDLSK